MTDTQSKDIGPIGSGGYTVKRGDCIYSIAYEHGFFWETIWNDSANQVLRKERKEPGLILPGDKLTIPDKEKGQVDGADKARHRFKLKDVPAKLKFKFLCEEPPEQGLLTNSGPDTDALNVNTEDPDPPIPAEVKPRKNISYDLKIDGNMSSGETDDQGEIELFISPNAKSGSITFEPGTEKETTIPIRLGNLDPVSELCGVKQRLNNLGFPAGEETAELTPECEAAISEFQASVDIEPTGLLNDSTRNKLEEAHGS